MFIASEVIQDYSSVGAQCSQGQVRRVKYFAPAELDKCFVALRSINICVPTGLGPSTRNTRLQTQDALRDFVFPLAGSTASALEL